MISFCEKFTNENSSKLPYINGWPGRLTIKVERTLVFSAIDA